MLLYSSEFNWSSHPCRILKGPSTLLSSAGSWGWECGRGPKSLLARARLGRWEPPALTDGRADGAGDCRSWRAAAEEELGRDGPASCDGRLSGGAENAGAGAGAEAGAGAGAALSMLAGAGACEASGLGKWWAESLAGLMVSSSVRWTSSQQRPCRRGRLGALEGSAVGGGARCAGRRAESACSWRLCCRYSSRCGRWSLKKSVQDAGHGDARAQQAAVKSSTTCAVSTVKSRVDRRSALEARALPAAPRKAHRASTQ